MKKSGRISLLSFEQDDADDDSGINFNLKPSKKESETTSTSASTSNPGGRPVFDLSSIKDRVTQMDLNEELVLEGEAAEALLAESLEEDFEMLQRIEKAKEARKQKAAGISFEEEEVLDDFIPVTSKAEYWLTRDTQESEEAFRSDSNSRMVREDLFNEREIVDSTGSFTNFMGQSSDGSKKGLMMTSRMLERDIRSELYDFELKLEGGEQGEELEIKQEEGFDEISWQKGQVAKGIEKGWASALTDDSIFLSKQNRLTSYIPPQNFFSNAMAAGIEEDALKLASVTEIESNIEKIDQDSQALQSKIKAVQSELLEHQGELNRLTALEAFFMKYSRFVGAKLKDLDEIEEVIRNEPEMKMGVKWKWEHFFDDVEGEDEENDMLDLPKILSMAREYDLTLLDDLDTLKGLTQLFIRYHFLALHLDERGAAAIWDESGLRDALQILPDSTIKVLIDSIFGEENGIGSACVLN